MGIFEQNKNVEKFGRAAGYVFSYLLFTTALFFILVLLKKIPASWTYFHILLITLLITLTGIILKRFLR